MGRVMLSKSLIQFSVDWQGYVPSLLFDLRPNYGGGDEDNGKLLQKVPYTHCCAQWPQPCSRPPLTHASTRDSWTLMGKSESASCRVTAPFFWVLVHTKFCLCLPRVCFPVLCKFWWLYGGVNGNLLQEAYAVPRSTAPRDPAPAAVHCKPIPPQETLKYSSVSVSVRSPGPGVHKVCLSPLSISGTYGV